MTTTLPKSYTRRGFSSSECYAMVAAGILSPRDREEVLAGRRRFTVDEYYALAEVGILSEYERIELLDGEIIEMAPIGEMHNDSTDCLNELLVFSLMGRARVRVQGSVRLDEWNNPEPDFVVLRRRPDYHLAAATPADVYFLIEVSYSSLQHDRGRKLESYARAGIPEVWIANLRDYEIEAHTNPAGDQYQTVRRFFPGDQISPQAFPDVILPVADFWSGMVDFPPEASE